MTAADRPSVTDNARAEAEKAVEAIIDYSGDLPPGAPSRAMRARNVVATLAEASLLRDADLSGGWADSQNADQDRASAEFDRWLAAHDAEVRREQDQKWVTIIGDAIRRGGEDRG